MSGSYQTKVMRPANLKGIAAAKESLDQAISDAEKNNDNGDITVTAVIKNGSIYAVRQHVNRTIPMTDKNT